jgi:hypothetical protein
MTLREKYRKKNFKLFFQWLKTDLLKVEKKDSGIYCGDCKWFNQDEHSCRCFNPKQTNQSLIEYAYWSFECGLFEEGKRPTEEEMKTLGYEKKYKEVELFGGGTSGWFYYSKNK